MMMMMTMIMMMMAVVIMMMMMMIIIIIIIIITSFCNSCTAAQNNQTCEHSGSSGKTMWEESRMQRYDWPSMFTRYVHCLSWCFSDRVSWIDYTLITSLMHWLLFIHKILFSSICFEPQVLIFRRIQLYTCSIWYCHSLREFVVACRYTTWVRTDWRGKVVSGCLKRVCNLWHTFTS